jgi:hypothetical protein
VAAVEARPRSPLTTFTHRSLGPQPTEFLQKENLTMPLSDETLDGLDQIKKGKSRKFVLLTKGASIINLVLYKKGPPTKYVKEAKETGTGTPCFGVIDGRYPDLVFSLATVDGFKDAPVKDLVLKKFLEEEAKFKCKPTMAIVEALPVVLDENDPLHARFMQLYPLVSQALDNHPDRTTEISTLVRQIGSLLDADQRDPATAKLVELETLLNSLGGTTTTDDKAQTTYLALRAKLEPMLLAAQRAQPGKATALGNVWNYAEAQAQGGNYAVANKALAGLADSLAKATAEAKQGEPTTDAGAGRTAAGPKLSDTIPAAATAFADGWPVAKQGWLNAIETVDTQIEKLQNKLRQTDDGDLWDIAEFGMNAVTGDWKVPLQAAIMDVDRAQADTRAQAAKSALEIVDEFADHLANDERVAVCDENPFDVPVALRDTLGAALRNLTAVLKTAA